VIKNHAKSHQIAFMREGSRTLKSKKNSTM